MEKQTVSKQKYETRESNESRRTLFDVFVNYLKPSIYIKSINDIDIRLLKKQGIKLIICDLDNTLVPHYTKFPTQNALKFVERAHESGMKFILVSNNTSKRVSFFAEKLEVEDYVSGAKKPFPFAISKQIKKHDVKPSETVMIGDMIITDMIAANMLKTDSILVSPLIDGERAWTKIMAWTEKKVFKRLEKNNLLVTSMEEKSTLKGDEYELL